MNKTYFIAYLKNGRLLDFNKNCTSLNFSKESLCIFQEQVGEKEYEVIAVIPYDSISSVERVTELVENARMPIPMPINTPPAEDIIGDEIS